MLWSVPKLWPDSTVYILGGGYSLLNERLHLIRNEKVIGVNIAFKLGDWVDICWFGDKRWYQWNKEKLKDFEGLKVACCPVLEGEKGIKVLDREKKLGMSNRPDRLYWNWCSGSSAIDFAHHLGAKKIVLLGFDMKPAWAGKNNWHDDHEVKDNSEEAYPKYLSAFPEIAKDAIRKEIVIINSTMSSVIPECYIPKMPLEEVVENENQSCYS